MTDQEIADRVDGIMVELFELEDDLTPQSKLYEELGLDSLDSVDMVVALEKEFNFKVVRNVDEEKIRAIRTLKDVYAFVREKLG